MAGKAKWVRLVGVVTALAFGAASAGAETITVDEFGNGTGTVGPGTIILDPTVPGGSVLAYQLPFFVSSGDVALVEDPSTGAISDIIRFKNIGEVTPPPPGPGSGSLLLFYSDNGEGIDAPADQSGIPASPIHLTMLEMGPEGDNGLVYTPTPGEPGYNGDPTLTYDFVSDVPTGPAGGTPEPSTLALLGGASVLLCVCRRAARRKRRQPAVDRKVAEPLLSTAG